MPFKIKIKGIDHTVRALNKLTPEAFRKVIPNATRAAMRPVGKKVKANLNAIPIPTATSSIAIQTLAASLGSRTRKYKTTGGGTVVVVFGPRSNFVIVDEGRNITAPALASILEFGSPPHAFKTRGGFHPGTDPHPFMRSALDGSFKTVEIVYASKLDKGIQRIVKKLAREQLK